MNTTEPLHDDPDYDPEMEDYVQFLDAMEEQGKPALTLEQYRAMLAKSRAIIPQPAGTVADDECPF